MKLFRCLGALFMLLVGGTSFAGNLFAPFATDSAGVMPKKIRNLRVLGFTTEIGDKYNSSGNTVPLGNPFNQKVTWSKLIDAQPAGFARAKFKGGVRSKANVSDEVGIAEGAVNTRVTVTSPVLAYGVNEKLTLGLAIPVYYTNINVATGWTANTSFQKTLNEFVQEGQLNSVEKVESKLNNVVETKIANNGYKPLVNEQRQEIGDITLGGKYLVFKNDDLAAVVTPKIVFPTGRVADVDKVVDVPSGDGQFDIGIGSVLEYTVTGRLSFNSSVNLLHQLPTTKAKRVPVSADESLTPDVDQTTFEKIGDIYALGMGSKYKVHELVTVGTGYTLQYKQSDVYSGSQFAGGRYDYLEKDTEQVMQSVLIGLTGSTIPLFRSNKFPVPLEASLNYASVFAGRNVNKVNLTSFELAAFF